MRGWWTSLGVGAVACAVLVSSIVRAPVAAAQSDPWSEPVARFDFPDPDLVIDDAGTWFGFATGGGWFSPGPSTNIRLATSQDGGSTWTLIGEVLPEPGRWALNLLTWAPSVTRLDDGTWVMHYSAPERTTGRQCIGVAASTTLLGPFVDSQPAPVVCQPELGGSIDPDIFRDRDGTTWLTWKNDGNVIGAATFIWVQPLTADGTATAGSATRLLGVNLGWEDPIIEHPAVVVDAELWLLYSAGRSYLDASYSTGVARCSLPRGPCSRSPVPLLATGNLDGVVGPGGAHSAADPTGARWMLHHGLSPTGTERWLYRRPLTITGDVVASAGPTVTVRAPTEPRFADLVPAAFYLVAVEWADRLGITTGTTPTTFSPERHITRAEVAAFLHRSVGSPRPQGPSPFVDVPPGAFYADAVAWLSEAGVTTGTTPTTFSPEWLTKRSEAVTFLHRLLVD